MKLSYNHVLASAKIIITLNITTHTNERAMIIRAENPPPYYPMTIWAHSYVKGPIGISSRDDRFQHSILYFACAPLPLFYNIHNNDFGNKFIFRNGDSCWRSSGVPPNLQLNTILINQTYFVKAIIRVPYTVRDHNDQFQYFPNQRRSHEP